MLLYSDNFLDDRQECSNVEWFVQPGLILTSASTILEKSKPSAFLKSVTGNKPYSKMIERSNMEGIIFKILKRFPSYWRFNLLYLQALSLEKKLPPRPTYSPWFPGWNPCRSLRLALKSAFTILLSMKARGIWTDRKTPPTFKINLLAKSSTNFRIFQEMIWNEVTTTCITAGPVEQTYSTPSRYEFLEVLLVEYGDGILITISAELQTCERYQDLFDLAKAFNIHQHSPYCRGSKT